MKKIKETLKNIQIKNGLNEYLDILNELQDFEQVISFHTLFLNYLLRNRLFAEEILIKLTRILERCGNKNIYVSLFANVPDFFYEFLNILKMSDYLTEVIVKSPEIILWLFENADKKDFIDEFPRSFKYVKDGEYKLAILNKFKKQQYVRIFFNDINARWEFEEVVTQITKLADFIVQKVLEKNQQELGLAKENFCIIGLGKLGGFELNYSSDIDLLMCLGNATEDMHIYEKLAQRIINDLSFPTEEGFLYRVDLRLRPEGTFGPIVRSVDSYINYYYNYGEIWERQALLKMRFVGGDRRVYDELKQELQGFIFSKFDYIEMLEIDNIRHRIYKVIEERKGEYRGRFCLNIKTGRGGIRDIEFSIQFLQLYYKIPAAGTLEALQVLIDRDLVSAEKGRKLREHYIFLRRVEHFLQMRNNKQVYSLPYDIQKYKIFIKRIGYRFAEFNRIFHRVQRECQHFYRSVITRYLTEHRRKIAPIVGLFTSEEDMDLAREILRYYGFKDIQNSYFILKDIVKGKHEHIHPSIDRRVIVYNLHDILEYFKRKSVPDWALVNFANILEGLGSVRFGFFKEYLDDPVYRKIIKAISAFSCFLPSIIASDPDLFDSLTDDLIGDNADIAEMKNFLVTSLMIKFLLRLISLPRLHSKLSDLLDIVIKHEVEELLEKYGVSPNDILIVVGGKYGTKEPTPFSDVDLLYLTYSDDVAVTKFYEHLTQRLTRYIPGGQLYEVDLRLRPEGAKGSLTTNMKDFIDYLSNRASFWEFLSYTRLRCVYGDKKEFLKLKRKIYSIFHKRGFNQEAELKALRSKSIKKLKPSVSVNYKKTSGGLLDIELLAHFLALQMKIFSGKVAHVLRRRGLHRLAKNYVLLHQIEVFVQIMSGLNIKHIPEGNEKVVISKYFNVEDIEKTIYHILKENKEVIDEFI